MNERFESGPRHGEERDGGEERIGIFPGWGSLYTTVIVYGVLLIVLLYLLTVALDFGSR